MTIRMLLNYWIGKKRSGFYVFLGFCASSVYLAGFLIQSRQPRLSLVFKRSGFLALLVIIPLIFIHRNLHALHWFLEHFKDTDRLPKKQIALVNSFCMTLFLTVAFGALPAAAFFFDPLWQAIGRWFASRTSLDKAVYPALYMESTPIAPPDLSGILGEPKPPAPWIVLLDKIVRAAGSLLILFLALLAVRILLLKAWAWITKPRNFDSDEKVCLTPVWTLPSEKQPAKRRLVSSLFGSYDEKIRQKYRREILILARKKRRRLSAASSPRQLEEAVGLADDPLHRLYEKARYSREKCTRNDWDSL